MILKRYLRLRCVKIVESCVFAGERIYQMLVIKRQKRSGDTPVGAAAKLNPLLSSNKGSPTRLKTHLCELRNVMFYIQIQ